MDAHAVTQSWNKQANRLRNGAGGAAEIVKDLLYIAERGQDADNTGCVTEKTIENDAKYFVNKALKLPASVRSLENVEDEDEELQERFLGEPETKGRQHTIGFYTGNQTTQLAMKQPKTQIPDNDHTRFHEMECYQKAVYQLS
ncbi:hypothetical protein DFQ28_001584 [Apophysomyces sp. BC1034]|nr:hypothetical protein DFQ30_008019 [Apophysomyces sp. BC1015]KAG0182503.1 hypothetical protein DFQ29_003729 [Apophysomyces sp. BC1021]KAG0194092.1 hypothetical protein DFQ28_001584 [Apophysomyces sp. BC1034]